MRPRSDGDMPRQLGFLNAFRAAWTAVSTSLADAACTDVIMDSSLRVGYLLISKAGFEEKFEESSKKKLEEKLEEAHGES